MLAGIRYTDYNFGMPKAQVVAGVKAQLAKPRYLSAGNNWLCPSYPARFMDYGNTYTWSIATIMGSATSIKRGRKIDSPSSSNNWVMWDNFSHLPYTPGAIFPTPGPSGYTLAGGVDKWIIPHRSNNGQSNRGVNFLFLDGHVEKLSYSSVGSGSPWVQ